jgi:hypothetical protein
MLSDAAQIRFCDDTAIGNKFRISIDYFKPKPALNLFWDTAENAKNTNNSTNMIFVEKYLLMVGMGGP